MSSTSILGSLAQTDWARFETAYGSAENVPNLLARLASEDQVDAMGASHELWCSLCHQHAYVSSAALPALPFILEVLSVANASLAVEILDILLGFATCSRPSDDEDAWIGNLRQSLLAEQSRFRTLANHQDENIASFAGLIVESLNDKDQDPHARDA